MIATLYKKNNRGAIQQWTIEVEEDKFRTIEGQVDGKLTTSEWTTCKGKNVGRANELTPDQSATAEAESKVQKKKDSGYVENIDLVDEKKESFDPMLAHKYDDHKDSIEFPVYSQPKLDGVRCIVKKDGMFTRNGKKIVSAPHIFKAFQEFFILLPEAIFDGELYNHDLKNDFNKIISLVKKQKPNVEELKESEDNIQYWIYDSYIKNSGFSHRFETLEVFVANSLSHKGKIALVHTKKIESQEEMDDTYAAYLLSGYEGQMIRRADSLYENKRSKNLLKRKEFEDQEFTIVDIIEGDGNRSGMMGRVRFTDGKITFDSNARGTHGYFKELLVNKDKYIGKKATVRYQNLTPDGIPRFPVMIAIRDFE